MLGTQIKAPWDEEYVAGENCAERGTGLLRGGNGISGEDGDLGALLTPESHVSPYMVADPQVTLKADRENEVSQSPATAGDNSLSVHSNVNAKCEDPNSCVASSTDYVASSAGLRRNSDGLRRIQQENTSQPAPEPVGEVEAKLLERFGRFALASVEGRRLHWRADPSKAQHLAVWKFKAGWSEDAAGRRVRMALGKGMAFTLGRHCLVSCLIASSSDPQQAIEQFTARIGCLEAVANAPMTLEVLKLLDGIDQRVVPIERLEECGRTLGALLADTKARFLWDDDVRLCLKRLFDHLARRWKRCPSAEELISQACAFGLDDLWEGTEWEDVAGRVARKYKASWDEKKVARSPVLPGCFTTLLKIAIPEGELLSWPRQHLRLEEVEAVLNKITRNVLNRQRPNHIARKYWESAWEEKGKHLKRKLNADKIGKITDLLVRHGFLTKKRGFKKPSLYGLGIANPFYAPRLAVTE